MAIVNVSLDTGSRQVVLTVNGVLVLADDIFVERYVYGGEAMVRFGYTIESVNANGMKERRQFYLPPPEGLATEAHAGLDEEGFASKILHDDEKAKADVIDFFKRDRK
ncbi:MAG: hypothetical protein DRJ03_00665 [Chloroflexi bacterium]|nr:MAG: hypothetical protein DRJ03_00665 [Chloroflexota bacterium]